jgi:hypothetical protein
MAWNGWSLSALKLWMEAGNSDWQPKFELLYLLIQLDLAEDDNTKIVELYEDYNFVNWLKDWFGLVGEL